MFYCALQQKQEEAHDQPLQYRSRCCRPRVLAGVHLTAAEEPKPLGKGVASWSGPGFHGKKTANGERFNTHDLTAAHKTLPFGTQVRVTNEQTGKSVVVRINDRGPYAHGRVIDLSKAAAEAVGIAGTHGSERQRAGRGLRCERVRSGGAKW